MDDLRESHHDHHDRGAPRREAAPEEPGRCAPGRPMTARVRGMASPACAASAVRVAQRSELMERAAAIAANTTDTAQDTAEALHTITRIRTTGMRAREPAHIVPGCASHAWSLAP